MKLSIRDEYVTTLASKPNIYNVTNFNLNYININDRLFM